ncbi:hypothetical protein SUGI_1122600 [Cryptomeria japonica]|uniref:pectinesterase-like n=1 Tax=Cryptomeria japonica TaxID=3369 RepID=UPI002414703C|nr:pectinesterase-like [Cryptomeria japonica]GLJ52724.1 hypothetical protein SUGI_1122600 [Cryptomeria japonica]
MASNFNLLLIVMIFLFFSTNGGANPPNAIKPACELAPDRKACEKSLSENPRSLRAGRKEMTQIALNISIPKTQTVRDSISSDSARSSINTQAVDDCRELYDLTVDYLRESLSILTESSMEWKDAVDIQSYQSAALTNQITCLESLNEAKMDLNLLPFTDYVANASVAVSNSLAIVEKLFIRAKESQQTSVNRRRLLSEARQIDFFSWMSGEDRRLLLQTAAGVNLTGNVLTVAKNGSGNYTTITDAINAVANKSSSRTVIYVMAGVYEEYVRVGKNKYNIMIIGDGKNATVITGNRSVADGYTTFKSATFATVGKGFIARDLTIQNTAGPKKHQAVALRVGGDQSAFYRCSFKGYQDTLYSHSFCQFYRECDIYGTVDFIFGNSAVVFQNCTILARKPLKGQKNTITAQGRTDPNQNTGTSIHACNVTAAPDLVPVISSFHTYLGRPWKKYSRAVYMQSYLGSLIDPAGWLVWNGSFALSTLYFGEYENWGPGSNTSYRVKWPGYHVMNRIDALNFTVSNFVNGDTWLPATSIPYRGGLY